MKQSGVAWPSAGGHGLALGVLEALWEAPIPMAVLDRQLRLALVNAAFSATTGHPPEAHVGVPPHDRQQLDVAPIRLEGRPDLL